MCKKLSLENIIFAFVTVVWLGVFILIPIHIVIYPNFSETASTFEMIRSLDNACITVSSVILATILAMMAIIITKVPKIDIYRLLDVSSLPFFGIVTGLFSLYLSYFDFSSSKFLLAFTMEFTIGGIFALYLILTLKKKQFFDDTSCERNPST
jgi:hypothetical protein